MIFPIRLLGLGKTCVVRDRTRCDACGHDHEESVFPDAWCGAIYLRRLPYLWIKGAKLQFDEFTLTTSEKWVDVLRQPVAKILGVKSCVDTDVWFQ